MPCIIDGNNLIGSSPDLSHEDPDVRLQLLKAVIKYQKVKKNNIVLVFDGQPEDKILNHTEARKINVVFSGGSTTASVKIREILESYSNCKDAVVITSDRELKTFSRKNGAKSINSIEFYYKLKRFSRNSDKFDEKQKRIEVEVTENEVDDWMKIFEG